MEVVHGVGGGEGEDGRVGRGDVGTLLGLLLLLLLLLSGGKILTHMLQPFDESLLLPVGPEMRILGRGKTQ